MQSKIVSGLALALLMTAAAALHADETLAPQAQDQPPMGAPAAGGQPQGGPPAGAPGAPQDGAAVGASAADGMAPSDPGQGGGPGGMAGGGGADPAQAFEELKDQLGLSDDQAAKLKAIGEDAKAKNRDHMRAMMDLIKTLDGQVQSKAADPDLQSTLDKLKAERKAMQSDRDAAMDQREAVLTPTQAAKFVLAMRDKMRQGMLRRMRKAGNGQDQGGPPADQQ